MSTRLSRLWKRIYPYRIPLLLGVCYIILLALFTWLFNQSAGVG
jgi:hypothetical protein